MTFDEWHKANAKYMEPVDIVDWCREAYEAGRADENEACADMVLTLTCMGNAKECFEVAATYIRARGQG